MRQSNQARVDDLMVMYHSARELSEDRWRARLGDVERHIHEVSRILIWSERATLSVSRRYQAVWLLAPHAVNVAVISPSPAVRWSAFAMGWATDHVKAFHSDEVDKAYDYLALDGPLRMAATAHLWFARALENRV